MECVTVMKLTSLETARDHLSSLLFADMIRQPGAEVRGSAKGAHFSSLGPKGLIQVSGKL